MRGVWLSGFERSSFLAGAEAVPNGPDRYGNAVWVDFAPDVAVDPTLRAEMDRMGGTVAVAIAFDGRRSRDAGRSGHKGVDRKSGVEGKRVAVRVEFGGRRVIKKKK